jgi:hypothetical protein
MSRAPRRPGRLPAHLLAAALCLALPACGGAHAPDGGPGDPAAECGALPPTGLYATFVAAGEYFHATLSGTDGIAQAVALWRGESQASIPIVYLVSETQRWNCGYSWIADAARLTFAESAIELCDGAPHDARFAFEQAGVWCPWGAQLVQLRDCRTDPACPVVSR